MECSSPCTISHFMAAKIITDLPFSDGVVIVHLKRRDEALPFSYENLEHASFLYYENVSTRGISHHMKGRSRVWFDRPLDTKWYDHEVRQFWADSCHNPFPSFPECIRKGWKTDSPHNRLSVLVNAFMHIREIYYQRYLVLVADEETKDFLYKTRGRHANLIDRVTLAMNCADEPMCEQVAEVLAVNTDLHQRFHEHFHEHFHGCLLATAGVIPEGLGLEEAILRQTGVPPFIPSTDEVLYQDAMKLFHGYLYLRKALG